MAKAIIGTQFTFNFLMADLNGNPIIPVAGATIEVFYFDDQGVKQSLLPAGTAMIAVPANPGRYARMVAIPLSLNASIEVYGLMQGTDPVTGEMLMDEQSVSLVEPVWSGGNLRTTFIKPPNFP